LPSTRALSLGVIAIVAALVVGVSSIAGKIGGSWLSDVSLRSNMLRMNASDLLPEGMP
jgi:ABC-type methionine transport system permease subunit